MKRLLGILFAILMSQSQASTNPVAGTKASVIQPRTVTRSAQVLVGIPRIPKYKLLRSNPHHKAHFISNDEDDGIDDEGIATAYRRRDLQKILHEEGVSEDIAWRLFLARQMAMLKYREQFG